MFEQRLAATALAVEARLEAILAEASGAPERLVAAMRHATLGGGKRFRPFLVVEAARIAGGAAGPALDVAAALECVHCYSLVHDDLPAMDNDETRRGRPTVWKAFDEWTAILAGDGLLSLAFEIIARAQLPAERGIELIGLLAVDAGRAGMVGGQALDLSADKRGEPVVTTFAHIERLQAMKTGALIRFACEAGAICAGASSDRRAVLAAYGRHLGLAFQIADDLLDATGDAAAVGKAVGKDGGAGKATLVSLIGIDAARARLSETVKAAVAALAPFGAEAATLQAAARFMESRDR